VLVSETSGPVSSRTRSSEKRTDDGGDREASRGGGDATNATATGRGATLLWFWMYCISLLAVQEMRKVKYYHTACRTRWRVTQYANYSYLLYTNLEQPRITASHSVGNSKHCGWQGTDLNTADESISDMSRCCFSCSDDNTTNSLSDNGLCHRFCHLS